MAITAGTTNVCAAHSGGLVEIHLIDRDDLPSDGTAFTLTGDDYSAVTPVATKVFKKFEFEQDTAARRETTTRGDGGTMSILHEVEFAISQLDSANRKAIQDLITSSPCGMVAIVKDANARQWVVGYSESFTNQRALRINTSTMNSGTAFTDPDNEVVILDSTDNTKDVLFTGTIPV